MVWLFTSCQKNADTYTDVFHCRKKCREETTLIHPENSLAKILMYSTTGIPMQLCEEEATLIHPAELIKMLIPLQETR